MLRDSSITGRAGLDLDVEIDVHKIRHGTGRTALHVAEVVALALRTMSKVPAALAVLGGPR